MALVQDDHVIQAFAADTPDEPLDVGVLPRTPGGDHAPLRSPCAAPAAERRRHRYGPDRAADTAGPRPTERRRRPAVRSTAAVGCSVMLKCTTRRRSWARITSTKSTLWVTVGTTKKSRATTSLTWLCRKAFHVGEGGLRGRTRYFSTVDLATSMPSFRSSPTIRGEPHVGFACHIAWMSCADLLGHGGATGRSLLTQAPPVVTKALLLPGDHCAGLDECQGIAPARPEPRQPRPEQAIGRTKARAINGLLVDRQLMPQGQVFQAQ